VLAQDRDELHRWLVSDCCKRCGGKRADLCCASPCTHALDSTLACADQWKLGNVCSISYLWMNLRVQLVRKALAEDRDELHRWLLSRSRKHRSLPLTARRSLPCQTSMHATYSWRTAAAHMTSFTQPIHYFARLLRVDNWQLLS
jgi:hypothetical protein